MPTTKGAAGPIHWIQKGSGTPVVLLHGLGGDVGFWEAEIGALASRHRVIAIDLRGSGATPPSPGGHSMDDLADDVIAVLDDLDLERAHVVGFSMGGCVAQALAVRHQHRVDRLVLASTFAVMNAQARLFLDAVAVAYSRTASAKEVFDLICPWLFAIPFLADPANATYLRYDDDTIDFAEMNAWMSAYSALQRFDNRAVLTSVSAPTLVVAGRHDSLASIDDSEYLRDSIPEARMLVIENAGHLTNIEQPVAFLITILDHLDR